MFSVSRLKATLLAALLLITFSCVSASTSYSQNTTDSSGLTVLFSNNMAGDYKSCG